MQKQLALLQLHNASYSLQGQIIRARVLDIDRKKILIDTGVKIAKIAHSDITTECIVGTTRQDDAPRKPGITPEKGLKLSKELVVWGVTLQALMCPACVMAR